MQKGSEATRRQKGVKLRLDEEGSKRKELVTRPTLRHVTNFRRAHRGHPSDRRNLIGGARADDRGSGNRGITTQLVELGGLGNDGLQQLDKRQARTALKREKGPGPFADMFAPFATPSKGASHCPRHPAPHLDFRLSA
ncbi:hypothetical protein ANO11243_034910 [Dothideomycetidae sp. 11243]|nr:hypothetical protein ANO11243_034910 [fungal sp. No.11243]